MGEYEIAYLLSEHINRMWEVIQFWTSVSFGLIALSHLGAQRLNLGIVLIISFLYLMFSLYAVNIIAMNEAIVAGFMQDIENLIAQEALSSDGILAVHEAKPSTFENLIIRLTSIGTFISAMAFLWFSFLRTRKKN